MARSFLLLSVAWVGQAADVTCFGNKTGQISASDVCPGSVCKLPAFEPVIPGVDGLWAGASDSFLASTTMQEGMSGLFNGFVTGKFDNYASTYTEGGVHLAYNFLDDSFAIQQTHELIAEFYGQYVAANGANFSFTNPPVPYNATRAFEQNNCIIQPSSQGPGYIFFTFNSSTFLYAGGTAIFNAKGTKVARQYATITSATSTRNATYPPGIQPVPPMDPLNSSGVVAATLSKYLTAIADRDARALGALYSETALIHYYNAAEDQFQVFSKENMRTYFEALFGRLDGTTIQDTVRLIEEEGETGGAGNAYIAYQAICPACKVTNMSSTLLFDEHGDISGEGVLSWVEGFEIPETPDSKFWVYVLIIAIVVFIICLLAFSWRRSEAPSGDGSDSESETGTGTSSA